MECENGFVSFVVFKGPQREMEELSALYSFRMQSRKSAEVKATVQELEDEKDNCNIIL